MTDTSAKYARAAERWSEEAYADSVAYLRHRAELIVSLGLARRAGEGPRGAPSMGFAWP